MSRSSPETETIATELAAIRKALEDIADGHGKHYNGKFPRDNAWAALDRVEKLEAALAKPGVAQRPAVTPLLEATKKLLIAASLGSCTCNTKSPELIWHAPNCRYVTLMMALENVEAALSDTSTDREANNG